MGSPVLTVMIAIVIAFIAQKIAMLVYRYTRSLCVARQVAGLPGTRLIHGDLWYATFDAYFRVTLHFVQTTGVKMHKVWIYFFTPVYYMDHPDTAKVVLKSSAVFKPGSIGIAYALLKPWIGTGLLTQVGEKEWERARHLLIPAFDFDVLKSYVVKFNDVAEDLLIRLAQEGTHTSIEIGQPVTVAVLDALLRCAFSYESNIQELGQDHGYVSAVQNLSSLYIHRISNPFLYTDFVYKRTIKGKLFFSLCDFVHDFSDEIIARRKQYLKNSTMGNFNHRPCDFLDILLTSMDETNKCVTDAEMRSEVDTFLFAGHDTTSSAITWAIYALGKYPEEQENVYEEVMRVIGYDRVKWDDLDELKYMHYFIKEVLRMYSIVPSVGRELREPLAIGDVLLPAGSIIEINIHAINHRPDVWHDHMEFRPERFNEALSDTDPFTYIPFSAGQRDCIGQIFAINNMKVLLSRLVQTFRIELDPAHPVVSSPFLTMRTQSGIKVVLRSR